MSYRAEVYYECVLDLEELGIMATKKCSFTIRKSWKCQLELKGHAGRVETTHLVFGFPIYGSYLNYQRHPENEK